MKIIVEHTSCEENKIILKCAHLDDEMLEILAFLKERTIKLLAHRDGEVFMLMPDEIFYAETLDGRTILYTKDDIFILKIHLLIWKRNIQIWDILE